MLFIREEPRTGILIIYNQSYRVKSIFHGRLTTSMRSRPEWNLFVMILKYQDFQIISTQLEISNPCFHHPELSIIILIMKSYQAADYIQDKIEIDYLIVNAGVRFDYFEPDGQYLKNPNNIMNSMNCSLFPDS